MFAAARRDGARVLLGGGDRGLGGFVAGVDVLVFAGVTFVLLRVGHTEDGGRVADSSGVEGDDVVGLDDGLADSLRRVVGQRGDDGATGAARVNEEGGRALDAGAVDGEREGDLVAVGVGPVEGCLEEGALVLARVGGVDALVGIKGSLLARAPGDLLLVVGLGGA